MFSAIKNWVDFTLNPYCDFCGATRLPSHPVCNGCYHDLPWLPFTNNQPIQHSTQAFSAFAYQTPISQLLLAIKFGKNLRSLTTLGQLTAHGILPLMDKVPEALLPVPLHLHRLRKRGFNQALELARPLAQQLGIPVITHAVLRQKATQAQTELDFDQRQRNIQQAFSLVKSIPYQHVVIFDDVITTGATSSELAALLTIYGIKRVDIWSCARTVFTSNKLPLT